MPEHASETGEDAPVVAVVVSLDFPGMTDEIRDLVVRFTSCALRSVGEAGARPVLVDSSARPLPSPDAVREADGVLVLGGGDVDPALYGFREPVANLYGVDRIADDYCVDLIRTSIEADKPVLAVCRGSQLLNVALGGTLIPDLEPSALHRGGPGEPMFLDECVTLTVGTLLHTALGRDRALVRSGHHQAVGDVAPSLLVAAIADDGVVEATVHRRASWVVGVQWHPEDPAGDALDRERLIGALVARAAKVRRSRG